MHVFVHSGIIIPFGLALLYAFSNGFRDSSTIVATVVSTRVLTPGRAFLLCAGFEFVGAVFIGQAVATTIGSRLSDEFLRSNQQAIFVVICAALSSAMVWGVTSWLRAWPTSNNQALIAGLLGAALATFGTQSLHNPVFRRVFIALIASPIIGFLFSTFLTSSLRWLGEWLTPKVKSISDGLHVLACLAVSGAHGSNDGQVIFGLLFPALLAVGLATPVVSDSIHMPVIIRLWLGIAIALGVVMGGRRILKKMGMKFYRIRDPQGLGAEMASAFTIVGCAMSGLPSSTTQVIAGSIVGAGVAKNPRAVRWHIVQEIMLSWLITLPVVGTLGYVICQGFTLIMR